MNTHLHEFLAYAAKAEIEFYNEATLQLELGLFLRKRLENYVVHLERPISHFGAREIGGKKEIDICILDRAKRPVYAVELKYPCNGRVPETMFDYCRDIRLCETLVANGGFPAACAFMVTADQNFRVGKKQDGIYQFFRRSERLRGAIKQPTGSMRKVVKLSGDYGLEWRTDHAAFAYLLTEVVRDDRSS